MSNEKKIDKIMKLLNMQKSAEEIGNTEEALAFGARAQELMLRYKIEMSDIEVHANQEDDIKIEAIFADERGRKRKAWREMLAGIIANAFSCRILVRPGTSALGLVGNTMNRRVAVFMISHLCEFVEQRSLKEYDMFYAHVAQHGQPERAKGFRKSWITGFMGQLAFRYEERAQALMRAESASVQERALAVVNNERLKVNEFLDNLGTHAADSLDGISSENSEGMHYGAHAATEVNLEANGIEQKE